MKMRQKSIRVEAYQLPTTEQFDRNQLPDDLKWGIRIEQSVASGPYYLVDSKQGDLLALPTDYIIVSQFDKWIVNQDIFKELYEER